MCIFFLDMYDLQSFYYFKCKFSLFKKNVRLQIGVRFDIHVHQILHRKVECKAGTAGNLPGGLSSRATINFQC